MHIKSVVYLHANFWCYDSNTNRKCVYWLGCQLKQRVGYVCSVHIIIGT